jgi:hypothetical protein
MISRADPSLRKSAAQDTRVMQHKSQLPSGIAPDIRLGDAVPYVLRFVKPIEIADRGQYINDCCVGGDLVLEQLLPSLRERYGELMSNQEDWGWFAWFEESAVRLAIDVHTEDEKAGEFQIQLTSRKPRLLLGHKTLDTPELEVLRELVVRQLRSWQVADLTVERQ